MSREDLVGVFCKLTSNVKLPFKKFEGEMYLTRHNFTGSCTQLDSRMMAEILHEECSNYKPVDEIDLSIICVMTRSIFNTVTLLIVICL